MIDVFVWQTASSWKAFAPQLGIAASGRSRSEALRQLRRQLDVELDRDQLRIIGGASPEKESECE